MCGRFVIAGNRGSIRDAFSVDEAYQAEVKPSWNVAPMQGIGFVSEQLHEGELVRRLEIARWGLVPAWSKDPKVGARMINARSETVTEKPSFRAAAAKRRALIPANGYYEWQRHEDEDPALPPRRRRGPVAGLRRPVRVLARPHQG
jgi:putative SOS response-associated peptidase YedK